MAFTSLNLSRFSTSFRRRMAALGYGTDSAVRARVQEEAQSSAVWAHYAPSVGGYPPLPRVAGSIKIDETAALLALAGGAPILDVLSYTAPDFKVGHTLLPLTIYFPSVFTQTYQGAGSSHWLVDADAVGITLADDWGYCMDLGRLSQGDWAGIHSNTGTTVNGLFECARANPGRWTLSCDTYALYSHDSTYLESLIPDESPIWMHWDDGSVVTYGGKKQLKPYYAMAPADVDLVDTGSVAASYVLSGELAETLPGGTSYLTGGGLFSSPATASSITNTADAATLAAADAAMLSTYNTELLATIGQKISIIRNGSEYQPGPRSNYGVSYVIASMYSSGADTIITTSSAHSRSTGQYITFPGTMANQWANLFSGQYSAVPHKRFKVTVIDPTTLSIAHDSSTYTAYAPNGTDRFRFEIWWQDAQVVQWLENIDNYASDTAGNNAYWGQLTGSKAAQEELTRTAYKAVDPTVVYIYYGCGDAYEGILGGTRSAGRRTRSQYGEIHQNFVEHAQTDYPGWELYQGYVHSYTSKMSGVQTFPEYVLNTVAQSIEGGEKLFYPWCWAGTVTSDAQWMGFLKFCYTTGCVGFEAGSYSTFDSSGRVVDSSANQVVRQLVIGGHVHATFSHLENYLRSGTLLEGDYNAWPALYPNATSVHVMSANNGFSANGYEHPSYEFAHDDTTQLDSKVVARKLDASNNWLICAWRCLTGDDKMLAVTVAGHAIAVNARQCGTLYHMDNAGTLTILDPLGMDPSRAIATILAGL